MPPEPDAYSLNLASTGCGSSPNGHPTLRDESKLRRERGLNLTWEDGAAETDFLGVRKKLISPRVSCRKLQIQNQLQPNLEHFPSHSH